MSHLFFKLGSEDSGGVLAEGVNPAGDAALVSEVPADPPLVLGAGPADEGAVEDEAVLGSVAASLESSEQSLLRPEDLHGAGRSLGQVGETARVGDQSGPHHVPDESGEVGSHQAHLGLEVGGELLAVVRQTNDTAGECLDVEEVDGRNVHPHGALAGVDDGLGPGAVHQNLLQLLEQVLGQLLPVLDELHNPGVESILWHNFDQLWEVVGVPLSDPHGERVDVLVQLVQESDGLDDHVVRLVDIELDFGPGVAVGQPELGFVRQHGGEALDKLGKMLSYSCNYRASS